MYHTGGTEKRCGTDRVRRVVMTLFTIGDSWTYGDELDNPKKESYPYLLSKKLNCRLVNYAVNGGSNDWMFRKTIEWVCSQDNLNGVIIVI